MVGREKRAKITLFGAFVGYEVIFWFTANNFQLCEVLEREFKKTFCLIFFPVKH